MTESLQVHGALDREDPALPRHDPHRMYGSDAAEVAELAATDETLASPLHPDLPYSGAEFVYAARSEMAVGLEDALARRTRCLLLDAEASLEIAPKVATLLASELGRDQSWINDEVTAYQSLAEGYRLST